MPRRGVDEGRREPAGARAEKGRSPLYKGFAKATFSIRPDQLVQLRTEARRRADEVGSFRVDASAIVREAIDAWLKRGGPGPVQPPGRSRRS